MESRRYDYSPVVRRKELKWPKDARIALWVGPNVECFHIDQVLTSAGGSHLPDIQGFTLREYGARIGIFRLMDVFDKYGIRASVLLNAEVCDRHPAIIEEGKKRNWEWLGHGFNNNQRLTSYPPQEEQQVICQVKEKIAAAVGKPPKGWLGPGLTESFNTPDHLAAEGFEYLCDWGIDDQPIPMRVRSGRMVSIPYQQGLNDITVFVGQHHSPEQYLQMVCDQFDTLYREAAEGGRVMALPLHPYITGLAFRIKYLDKALEYICSHEGVWLTTAGEIADWYYQNQYEDPGPMNS